MKEQIPDGVDLLVTEGTLLTRGEAVKRNPIQTEEQLGEKAAELFQAHKYNFVMVSSTNLDSIMEFYHHTPAEMCFVCDDYQAEVMLAAMRGRRTYFRYQAAPEHSVIYIPWKPWKGATAERQKEYAEKRCAYLRGLAKDWNIALDFQVADSGLLYTNGFVMLARKNCNPNQKSVFEIMRDKFYLRDGQIIYSMWDGYLKPEHGDQHLIDFIGGRPIEHLHVVVEPQWAFCDCFIENCARFSASGDFSDLSRECYNGAFGMYDDGLDMFLPPIYQHLSSMQDGVVLAKKDDLWGAFLWTARPEIPFEWDHMTFAQGTIVAMKNTGSGPRYTLFHEKPNYSTLEAYMDGLTSVTVPEGGAVGRLSFYGPPDRAGRTVGSAVLSQF